MMPCICVICFFLLLVWFVKSWPNREREITGLGDTHAVKALATKTLYHNSACYGLPATGEIRNTIDPKASECHHHIPKPTSYHDVECSNPLWYLHLQLHRLQQTVMSRQREEKEGRFLS
jgi:hypothetical protein